MKNSIYLLSVLITVAGFYFDHIENYPSIVKIFSSDHYYIMRALDNFRDYPKSILELEDPALNLLLNRYWPDLSSEVKVDAIGRTGMMQFSGYTSIGSDFELVINPKENALQAGLSYAKIRQKEQDLFDKKIGDWGTRLFWLGIVLFVTESNAEKLKNIINKSYKKYAAS